MRHPLVTYADAHPFIASVVDFEGWSSKELAAERLLHRTTCETVSILPDLWPKANTFFLEYS